MKKVAVLFNGGTISMEVDPKIHAAVPALTGEEIMTKVTGIENFAEIETYNLSNFPSPHITPKDMMDMSLKIRELLKRDDISGVVVTHGTDTLEETAYFLDLTIDNEKPVIITGAMRNSSELGYDGPANLAASICTAISKYSIGRGVLVCLNNELNLASEVTKAHSMHLDAFENPNFGPVGIVDNNLALYYKNDTHKHKILTNTFEEKVALIKCAVGMESDIINFYIDSDYKGIVIEGTGRGNIPPKMVSGVKRAIEKNIPVVLVSRCYQGRVLDTYGYKGGGKELRNLGIILGDTLQGPKARIKLMLALGYTKDMKEIKKIFEKGLY